MNECLNKHCKEKNEKLKNALIIEVAKMANILQSFKTFNDIEKYYKTYVKFQNKKVYKEFKQCSITYCKKFDKFNQKAIKDNINMLLQFINVKTKPPYYDDLINAINKITSQIKPNEDDIFKLSYYILIITFSMK
jgi:hypothetical protein